MMYCDITPSTEYKHMTLYITGLTSLLNQVEMQHHPTGVEKDIHIDHDTYQHTQITFSKYLVSYLLDMLF